MKPVDDFLNQITIYRLVLYCLILLSLWAFILSILGFLPFTPTALIFSYLILVSVCWITNTVLARLCRVSANLESVYITALILASVISPASNISGLLILSQTALLAISSKYILNIKGKHLFNPAAFGLALTTLILPSSAASWWVGTSLMMPVVLLSGVLITRKLQRFSMIFAFFVIFLAASAYYLFQGLDFATNFKKIFLDAPLLFFSFIMLTEPLTSPPARILQIIYGALVGLLLSIVPPEFALLIGNIFSYLFSPKGRLLLKLKEKIRIGPDMFDFIFDRTLDYIPGQYMEWTLGHKNPDSRGTRRYFTLASSPTEANLRIGVKFYNDSSSWKKSLLQMKKGDSLTAGSLSGEFTMPKDSSKKMVFIAGGIGITPFRSMIKYLTDTKQKRDIVLLYSVKTEAELVYKDIFRQAKSLGVKSIYITTDTMGYIDDKMISREVPDFKNRYFYISGPHSMVDAFKKTLRVMGIDQSRIKADFFPGYA